MSIADKLTEIAENVPKVYEAGKQAEYDAFWDAYQNYGNRTNYYVAFFGSERTYWNNNSFKPKYPIRPTNANNMLSNSGISGDLTEFAEIDFSRATIVSNALSNNDYITRVGVLDLRKVNTANISLIAGNDRLITVDEIIFKDDGTQYANESGFALTSCYNLKNLKITGKINFLFNAQYSPLTKDSITSVINALYEGSTGLTATFKKTAKEAAFTADEWAALIANKTNWTFSLV
jgi:hypothetical protein